MNAQVPLPEPWHTPWPADGVESVLRCPVCGDRQRDLLHADLEDRVFRVAPGRWQLWKCAGCGSGYLDPRPTPETIHLAYAHYYTHREPEGRDDYASLSPFRRLRRRLVNGYTNWRYGTRAGPATALGIPAAFALPGLKRVIDRQYRHLPGPPGPGDRLLDLGCGDGYFLRLARSCGWDVEGVDPDPQAGAVSQGFTVHQGGIECLHGKGQLFNVVTLNHVIEHVHELVAVLQRCHSLLKPGGQLWLETPNIESLGHSRFDRHWRGLEPPRHLVLFNQDALTSALTRAGFADIRVRSRPSPHRELFRASHALQIGVSPYGTHTLPISLGRAAQLAAVKADLFPTSREFLTMTATQ